MLFTKTEEENVNKKCNYNYLHIDKIHLLTNQHTAISTIALQLMPCQQHFPPTNMQQPLSSSSCLLANSCSALWPSMAQNKGWPFTQPITQITCPGSKLQPAAWPQVCLHHHTVRNNQDITVLLMLFWLKTRLRLSNKTG